MLSNEEMSYYINIKPETIFEFNNVWTEIVDNTGIYVFTENHYTN